MTPTGPDGSTRPSGKPTASGYLIGAIMVVAIVGGIWLAVRSGEDEASGGPAHIATSSGSTNGLTPDERVGTVPADLPANSDPGGDSGPVDGPDTAGQSSPDLAGLASAAHCELQEDLPEEGRAHLTRDDQAPEYGTDPPTSGDHIGFPLQQADGAWLDPAAPVDVVHSLEHGRIAIQYSPELDRTDQLALKGLYDSLFSAALLFPNPGMGWEVAATGWRNLIGCDRFRGGKTIAALRAFGATHQGKGPEPMEDSPPLPGPSFLNP